MCYLSLSPDEKESLIEAKQQYKWYKRMIRNLNKEDMLFNHKRIMFSRLALQWKAEVDDLKRIGKRKTWRRIKYQMSRLRRR